MNKRRIFMIKSLFISTYNHSFQDFLCDIKIDHFELINKYEIRVITKLPNSEQSYKGKVKTHKYIDRQNQSTTGKL